MFDDTQLIADILLPHNFKKRGKAFFRVHGDGILQVVKAEKERTVRGPLLRLGFHSLYSKWNPLWITSRGCIPSYEIANLIGNHFSLRERDPSLPEGWMDAHMLEAIPLTEQIEILAQHGVSILNAMITQQQLLDTMFALEVTQFGSVRWNDEKKIAPALACGNREIAERAIQAILDQHELARASHEKHSSPKDYQAWLERMQQLDAPLYDFFNLVRSGKKAAIRAYLSANYESNRKTAKFCIPPEKR